MPPKNCEKSFGTKDIETIQIFNDSDKTFNVRVREREKGKCDCYRVIAAVPVRSGDCWCSQRWQDDEGCFSGECFFSFFSMYLKKSVEIKHENVVGTIVYDDDGNAKIINGPEIERWEKKLETAFSPSTQFFAKIVFKAVPECSRKIIMKIYFDGKR